MLEVRGLETKEHERNRVGMEDRRCRRDPCEEVNRWRRRGKRHRDRESRGEKGKREAEAEGWRQRQREAMEEERWRQGVR